MPKKSLEDQIRELLPSIKNRRAQIVIQHILDNGYITTDELLEIGYRHAPRAAQDVKEAGIDLTTTMMRSFKTGRRMGSYTFTTDIEIRKQRVGGRRQFPKKFK